MDSVFISHSSKDLELAQQVADALKNRGCDVFLDQDPEDGIRPGAKWLQILQQKLDAADAVVFLATRNSVNSMYCFGELLHSIFEGKDIYQLNEPGVRLEIVKPFQALEITNLESAVERLVGQLRCRGWVLDSFSLKEGQSPFPGLEPFRERDAGVFYGRSAKIRETIQKLDFARSASPGSRILAVVGPSGSGKSSLVLAGVRPRLSRRPESWVLLPVMRPGADPIGALTETLVGAFAQAPSSAREAASFGELRSFLETEGSSALGRLCGILTGAVDPYATALLVVDQAEELLQAPPDQAERFLALLRGTSEPSRLCSLLTLPTNALIATHGHVRLADLLLDTVYLESLEPANLKQVIEEPCKKAGVGISEELVDRLVEDTATGDALPLLAYTLHQLYEKARIREPMRILADDYEQLGGVRGILSTFASNAERELQSRGRGEAMLDVLIRLVGLDEETGMPLPRSRPVEDFGGEAEKDVIQTFLGKRLLVRHRVHGHELVEPAHLALLREWQPLARRIEAQRTQLSMRNSLDRWAHEWDSNGRADSYLIKSTLLHRVRTWREEHPTEDLGAIVCSFLVRSEQRQRDELTRASEVLSNRILEGFRDDPEFGILLAAEGIRYYGASSKAVLALNTALEASTLRNVLRTQTTKARSAVIGVGCSPDAEVVVAALADGRILTWPGLPSGTEPVSTPTVVGCHDAVLSAFVAGSNAAGELIAVAGAKDGAIRIWNTAHGADKTLPGHDAGVHGVALSPDSQFLVSCAKDDTITVWDVERRKVRADLGRPGIGVQSVAWDATGRRILAATPHCVRVWTWDGRRATRSKDLPAVKEGVLSAMAAAPDGNRVAVTSDDRTTRVFDIDTRQLLTQLRGHLRWVWDVCWSPDGRRLMTVGDDRTMRLWDSATGEELRTYRGHTGSVRAVAWSGNGTYVVSGGTDGTVRVWVAQTAELFTLCGHDALARSVSWSPTGEFIATASDDTTARIWSARDGSLRYQLAGVHSDAALDIAWSPDGSRVATASDDKTVAVWRLGESAPELFPLNEQERVVRVGWLDNTNVVTGCADGGATVWDVQAQPPVPNRKQCHSDAIRALHCCAASRLIATGSEDGTCRVWYPDWTERAVITDHGGPVRSVQFSTDGTHLLTSSDDRSARVWDLDGGLRPASGLVIRHSEGGVQDALWSPGDVFIATACEDGSVRVWDAVSGDLVAAHPHSAPTRQLTWSPDATRLAVAWNSPTPRVWEAARRGERRVLGIPTTSITSAVWHPLGDDGTIALGMANGDVRLGGSGECVSWPCVARLGGPVSAMRWSSQGHLLCGTANGQVAVWDRHSGKVSSFTAREEITRIHSLAWAPSGQELAAACGGAGVLLWRIDAEGTPERLRWPNGSAMLVDWSPKNSDELLVGDDRGNVVVGSREELRPRIASLTGGLLVTAARYAGHERVITGHDDGSIRYWSAGHGGELDVLRGPAARVDCLEPAAAGDRVVSGSNDHTARIWDADTGTVSVVLRGHTGPVTTAAWSHDGRDVLTVSSDRTARIWEASTGDLLLALAKERTFRELSPEERRAYGLPSDGSTPAVSSREDAEGQEDRG